MISVFGSSDLLQPERTLPWTEILCRDYGQPGQRYASDITDSEWEPIAPFPLPQRRYSGSRHTPDVLRTAPANHPMIRRILADGGNAGDKWRTTMVATEGSAIRVAMRPTGVTGLVVIAHRRAGSYRRLVKDRERSTTSASAWNHSTAI
ncbi:MAG: transposase [Rhodobacteraceae bacterium]|nr:transposase [Paracoccaceae bacterium]